MIYKNQPVIGLELQYGLSVYADSEALDLIQLLQLNPAEVRPLTEKASFRDLLVNKLISSEWFSPLASKETMEAVQQNKAVSIRPMMINHALGIELTSKNMPEVRLEKNGTIKCRLNGPIPTPETIEFTLAPNGALMSAPLNPNFQPMIEVKGSLGSTYLIDLRRLFFVDLSRTGVSADPAWSSVSTDRRTRDFEPELSRASHEGPVLVFRSTNSDRAYEVSFVSASLIPAAPFVSK
jgi:hypothetical protein